MVVNPSPGVGIGKIYSVMTCGKVLGGSRGLIKSFIAHIVSLFILLSNLITNKCP